MLKEKEEYYMRINNANTDSIKDLEEELANWEVKFNEREEFWRKRMSDQMKLMEDIQKEVYSSKKAEKQANEMVQSSTITTGSLGRFLATGFSSFVRVHSCRRNCWRRMKR